LTRSASLASVPASAVCRDVTLSMASRQVPSFSASSACRVSSCASQVASIAVRIAWLRSFVYGTSRSLFVVSSAQLATYNLLGTNTATTLPLH
jgi:hypothetical protein